MLISKITPETWYGWIQIGVVALTILLIVTLFVRITTMTYTPEDIYIKVVYGIIPIFGASINIREAQKQDGGGGEFELSGGILFLCGLIIGGVLIFSGAWFSQEPQLGWVNTIVNYGWEFITTSLAAAGLSWKK